MAKTLRTSGDYTIKAGNGYNSGSGANTINLDSLNVSVTGNLTVGGSSTTVSTTNTTIEDNIIELNTGATANSNNAGIIIERGSTGDNAAIIWKEDTDTFIIGTTTATAADKSSSLSVTAGALQTGALTATTGTFSGTVTSGGSFKKAIHTFTGDDAITEVEHAGRTLLLGEVGGNANVVLTLPDATGSGNIYHFIVSVAMGGSTTYKIQVPDANNTITGQIMYLDEDGTAVTSFPTVATSDTITLNSGTQGGLVGDTLTLIDIAADKYAVSGNMRVAAGANPSTPFTAAVS